MCLGRAFTGRCARCQRPAFAGWKWASSQNRWCQLCARDPPVRFHGLVYPVPRPRKRPPVCLPSLVSPAPVPRARSSVCLLSLVSPVPAPSLEPPETVPVRSLQRRPPVRSLQRRSPVQSLQRRRSPVRDPSDDGRQSGAPSDDGRQSGPPATRVPSPGPATCLRQPFSPPLLWEVVFV